MKVKIADLEPKFDNKKDTKHALIQRYSGISSNWRLKQTTQELFHITDDLRGTHSHANYLEYLEIAWGNHFGVVITPDIIWHTLLSEIVQIVAENPKAHAQLFTEIPDKKQTIIIVTSEPVAMPLNVLVESIKSLVPTNTDAFMPEFSTTTDRARFARYAAFADLVSPYYNYAMLMCGIPYVDVKGTDADWQKLIQSWDQVGELFTEEAVYFAKVRTILDKIVACRDNSEFWKDMFSLERCGSGHQTTVLGWFADFYRSPVRLRYVCNFPSHMAKVCYRQLNTQKDYEMYHGVLSSNLEGDCLIPDFGSMIFHRPQTPVVTVEQTKSFARLANILVDN